MSIALQPRRSRRRFKAATIRPHALSTARPTNCPCSLRLVRARCRDGQRFVRLSMGAKTEVRSGPRGVRSRETMRIADNCPLSAATSRPRPLREDASGKGKIGTTARHRQATKKGRPSRDPVLRFRPFGDLGRIVPPVRHHDALRAGFGEPPSIDPLGGISESPDFYGNRRPGGKILNEARMGRAHPVRRRAGALMSTSITAPIVCHVIQHGGRTAAREPAWPGRGRLRHRHIKASHPVGSGHYRPKSHEIGQRLASGGGRVRYRHRAQRRAAG